MGKKERYVVAEMPRHLVQASFWGAFPVEGQLDNEWESRLLHSLDPPDIDKPAASVGDDHSKNPDN